MKIILTATKVHEDGPQPTITNAVGRLVFEDGNDDLLCLIVQDDSRTTEYTVSRMDVQRLAAGVRLP